MNVFCLFLLVVGLCHSVSAVWPETPFQAVNYLLRYGYLNPDYSMRTNPSKLLFYAVKNFQKKSMLNATGKIDEFTLRQMQKKRCGVPDFSRETLKNIFLGPDIRISLSKRDATQGRKPVSYVVTTAPNTPHTFFFLIYKHYSLFFLVFFF
ncbi:unnamed protein product [Acanthosepion pharaonis]|uniref:Peptidoglycan binding-like domain-containing protein n=1 Tax=Acanthosepion pharaonis TaxID=158019 RepID=A0A812EHY7_ACAPH|nr:unnamed protein product [Sepia pharaonis]